VNRPRTPKGQFLPGAVRPAILRFIEKLAFDPLTGCVMWIGGTTSGQGHNSRYGSFWFEGRRWFAHRWAAMYIHGLDIEGLQVDHCCPHGPHTLCVEHLKTETLEANRALQNKRRGLARQTNETKQYWLMVQRGYENYVPPIRDSGEVPFYEMPKWLKEYMT
jgi:hypothetical protein